MEVDNRLSWLLGALDEQLPDARTSTSFGTVMRPRGFAARWASSTLFGNGLITRPRPPVEERLKVAGFPVDTVDVVDRPHYEAP